MGQQLDLLWQIDHHRAEDVGRTDGEQLAVDTDKPLLDRQKAHQRTDERGLARAFRPRQTGQRPVFGNERKPLY